MQRVVRISAGSFESLRIGITGEWRFTGATPSSCCELRHELRVRFRAGDIPHRQRHRKGRGKKGRIKKGTTSSKELLLNPGFAAKFVKKVPKTALQCGFSASTEIPFLW